MTQRRIAHEDIMATLTLGLSVAKQARKRRLNGRRNPQTWGKALVSPPSPAGALAPKRDPLEMRNTRGRSTKTSCVGVTSREQTTAHGYMFRMHAILRTE